MANGIPEKDHLPVLGILGGGQLAKMTALAASNLGCKVAILDKFTKNPTELVCGDVTSGDWDDPAALKRFAARVDVVSLENEFVDADSITAAEAAGNKVLPGADTLRTVQDKWTQKTCLQEAGLPVPAFRAVASADELSACGDDFGWPLVLKQRRDGYDGKGNATARNLDEAKKAFASLSAHSAVMVEKFCPFERELAMMVTRSESGESVTYPVVETVQKDHICHVVRAPAAVSQELVERVRQAVTAAVDAFNGVGTFGVELFLLPNEEIVINEMAPRVHNSGHYTIEACMTSQFENHVRAVMGWPLGSSEMLAPAAVMVNLLGAAEGDAWPHGYDQALAVPGAHIHVYGKAKSKPGRKMGHVTALGQTVEEAEKTARAAADALQFGG
jgi:5-(carboxyamino)imidazole ribonucleotide synthase